MMVAFIVSSTQIGQLVIGVIVAYVGYYLNKKSKEIHVLVNARLQDALDEIDELQAEVDKLKGILNSVQ